MPPPFFLAVKALPRCCGSVVTLNFKGEPQRCGTLPGDRFLRGIINIKASKNRVFYISHGASQCRISLYSSDVVNVFRYPCQAQADLKTLSRQTFFSYFYRLTRALCVYDVYNQCSTPPKPYKVQYWSSRICHIPWLCNTLSLSCFHWNPLCVFQENPYVMLRHNHQDLDGNDRYEGFCVDMLKELADILKFKYRIRLVGDRLYGVPGANGTWTGMVGELISRVYKYIQDTCWDYVEPSKPQNRAYLIIGKPIPGALPRSAHKQIHQLLYSS